MSPKFFASTSIGADTGGQERNISPANDLPVKLYLFSALGRSGIVAGSWLILTGLVLPVSAQATESQIVWNCSQFADDSEARAAVEARSRVELSLVSAGGSFLAISCDAGRAQVALRIQTGATDHAVARVAEVDLPTDSAHAIDALVDAVWHLARQPDVAPPLPPPAPAPAPTNPIVARKPAHTWEVSAGASAQIFSGGPRGWAGPTLAAGLRTRQFAVGLAGGYNVGFATIDGLRLSALSACGFADFGVVGPLALGVSVGAFHLSVNAPSDLAPGSEGTWSPQLTLRSRLRLSGSHLTASVGPELHYDWRRPEVAIDDRVVFQFPHLSLGLAAELTYSP